VGPTDNPYAVVMRKHPFPVPGKVKLSLCFILTEHHAKKRRNISMHSLTSALDEGEWPASHPGRFTSRERTPGTQPEIKSQLSSL
jgi:hypothetical protein